MATTVEQACDTDTRRSQQIDGVPPAGDSDLRPREVLPSSFVADCAHEWTFERTTATDRCSRPGLVKCGRCRHKVVTDCKATARSKCGPCSQRHQGRVRRVFASGWQDRLTDRVYLCTLTAPGAREHVNKRTGKVCKCTPPGGVNAAAWHATLAQRWSWFMTDVRRVLGPVQFAKSYERQLRGLLHIHALMRSRVDLVRAQSVVRALAIRWGFGHECDVKAATENAVWYLAKYVTKTADERANVEWLNVSTGEIEFGRPRLRTWSASRQWGMTMKAIREEQRAWFRGAVMSTASGASREDAQRGGLAALLITNRTVTQTDGAAGLKVVAD